MGFWGFELDKVSPGFADAAYLIGSTLGNNGLSTVVSAPSNHYRLLTDGVLFESM